MHRRNSRFVSLCLVGMAVLPLAFAATAHADGATAYYYSYFDQHRPLGIDCSRVAVQAMTGADDAMLIQHLTTYGVDVNRLEHSGIIGWVSTGTPVATANAADVENLVAKMADSGDFAFVSPTFVDSRGEPLLITRDLLVGFHQDVSPQTAEGILAARVPGVITDRNFAGLAGVYRVRTSLSSGFDVLDMANALADLPEIKYAESDMIIRAEMSLIPNDPMFGSQWALDQANDHDMDAPEAWDLTIGDDSVIVVIMDCGIQQNHPDIHQIPGQDFSGHNTVGGGPYNDCDSHATSVAGCVSATINNGIGIAGVAPGCVVTSAKMGTTMELFGFCLPFIDSQASMVANSLNWAVTIGAGATNSSFGYEANSTMTTAYNNARTNGVMSFAATGNSGEGTISYPANLASVCAVGALNSSGTRASFGQYGTGLAFSAPGEGILTTDRTGSGGYEGGDYATVDGTSFSSPYAAGVAALIISAAPHLTPDEVEQVMNETCVDLGSTGYDTVYGWGALNAYNAVAAVSAATTPGDVDCDGDIDFDDIDPFVLALSGQAAYEAAYPDCNWLNADCDNDGDVDFDDIDAFVSLIGS